MAKYIGPIIPNNSFTEQAIAGAGQAILTAADRDIIKRRVGEINTKTSFTELVRELMGKTSHVDRVEDGIEQKVEADNLEAVLRLEKHMIKNSARGPMPKERIEISEDAKEEKIDNYHNDKKITPNKEGTLTGEKDSEYKRKAKIQALEASLHNHYVQMLLTDHILEKHKHRTEINSIVLQLQELGVNKNAIEAQILEAKKTAWLKSVILLKDLHLKRVFSGSKKEFEALSRKIKDHTLQARKLGLRVNPEGVKWVEAKLENMALETASYKLNLLKSMQKMSFDKEREKDIYWISSTIARLKNS